MELQKVLKENTALACMWVHSRSFSWWWAWWASGLGLILILTSFLIGFLICSYDQDDGGAAAHGGWLFWYAYEWLICFTFFTQQRRWITGYLLPMTNSRSPWLLNLNHFSALVVYQIRKRSRNEVLFNYMIFQLISTRHLSRAISEDYLLFLLPHGLLFGSTGFAGVFIGCFFLFFLPLW